FGRFARRARMPMFIVKLAPAAENDPLRVKINQAVKSNLEFAFPGYSFHFLPERDLARQFTVVVSAECDPKPTADQIRAVQMAVNRIATGAAGVVAPPLVRDWIS